MHDHATDDMLQYDRKGLTPRALRLHLDNSHDARTSGWDLSALDQLHHKLHAEDFADEAARLTDLAVAAELIADRLAAAPPAVVESVLHDDRSIYLTDANGTVYLAEPWYGDDYEDETWPDNAGPLYRLTVHAPPADLMEAIEESLAKAKQTLAKPRREERPVPPAVDALPAAPSVGAGGAFLPCAPAGSGSRDGGAS